MQVIMCVGAHVRGLVGACMVSAGSRGGGVGWSELYGTPSNLA